MKTVWMKLVAVWLVVLAPGMAEACSVCYGEPDSPVAKGLTWAITALGALVMCVLAGFVVFFVQASRKAAALEATEAATALIEKH